MYKPKKLTKPQRRMLLECYEREFVLAPAGVPTAWTLERLGLLTRVKMWKVTRCQAGRLIKETYKYEMHLTDKGKAYVEGGRCG